MMDPKKLEEEIKGEIFTPSSINEVTDADNEDTIILKVERAARKIIRERYDGEVDPVILSKLEEDIRKREEELIQRREKGEIVENNFEKNEDAEEIRRRIEQKLGWIKQVEAGNSRREPYDPKKMLKKELLRMGYDAEDEVVNAWYEVAAHFVEKEDQIPELVMKLVEAISRGGGRIGIAVSGEKKRAIKEYLKENYGIEVEVR